jgi:hypothetical protein
MYAPFYDKAEHAYKRGEGNTARSPLLTDRERPIASVGGDDHYEDGTSVAASVPLHLTQNDDGSTNDNDKPFEPPLAIPSDESPTSGHGHGGGEKDEAEDPQFIEGLSWPSSSSKFAKVRFILEWPVSLMRWLSIPPADGKWSRNR